jgi:dolichol-phosphate mannosyltransferase
MKLLSIVVPAFNEEAVLPLFYEAISGTLKELPERVELVFVNDGSRDRTLAVLHELRQKDDRVKIVSFSRNFGHQTAVSAGIWHARGDAVAVMDADLQDPPGVLVAMVARWRAGAEVVYAVRRTREGALWKRACYRLFYRLLRAMAAMEIPLDAGDFCVMDRRVVEVLRAMPEQSRFVRGLRSWAGFRQEAFEYDRPERASGETKYSLAKLVRLAGDGILGFSVVPLRAISVVGIAVASLSFATIGFYLIWRLLGVRILGHAPQDVGGFLTLVCLILFLGGMQLLALGIIGEYLGQVFLESKRRPLWVVATTAGFTDTHSAEGDSEETRP